MTPRGSDPIRSFLSFASFVLKSQNNVHSTSGFRPGQRRHACVQLCGFPPRGDRDALAQTYRDLEIIVVDDGSADHTRAVCSEFQDRVRYIYRVNDGTRGNGARARAVLESQGEWVALLDHDDRWLPTKIEDQVAAIGRNGRAGIVFTGARIVDARGLPTGQEFERGPAGTSSTGCSRANGIARPPRWSAGRRSSS